MDPVSVALTIAVLAALGFIWLHDRLKGKDARHLYRFMNAAYSIMERIVRPGGIFLAMLPMPLTFRYLWSRWRMKQTFLRQVSHHGHHGEDGESVLSMLLSTKSEDENSALSQKQIRNEVLALFFAGHETTAITLSWTWYLLGEHPKLEEKLHRELAEALGGREPTSDDLPRLPFTRRVLYEAIRLYPPAYVLERTTTEDLPFGEYTVPAGATIFLSPYVMHRDPRFYEDPDRFDPDRWLPDEVAKRPHFSFFPFGGGHHRSVGEPLALMEVVLLLATLAQRWRMRLAPGHPVEAASLVFLRPKHGLRMTLTRRAGEAELHNDEDLG